MDIRINNFNIYNNFKSKANPVQPFIIKTKHGKLKVSEVTQKDLKRSFFIYNLTKFFCKNFASKTKDPNWKTFGKHRHSYNEDSLKNFISYFEARIKCNNDDMTLLLAKDKRNKIQAACLAYGYDGIRGARDITCYIDALAVNPLYRNLSIGKILIEKVLDSAKNKFSDAFLAGDKESFGFYERLGFRPLNKNNARENDLINYIAKRRSDYPKYVELFTKPLKPQEERWYNKLTIKD